ncbi:transglycosylase SLT domain-containing protein [uncultured Paracoccus sp.]|uniref:transglycosylase SLT domain-containing protein n=1 Tax=uncultured Paracoccus sp. TaxID=189685 RepID=UPI0026301D54|nr:transglycosylase SLT domain-containing protein [uncultured Paracoccus sp.]
MQRLMAALVLAAGLAGCDTAAVRQAVTAPTIVPSERPGIGATVLSALPGIQPGMTLAWSGQTQSDEWTAATLEALQTEGVSLLSAMPADVLEYCPGYSRQSPQDRAAFWAGFLSKVASVESGWNPLAKRGDAVGMLGITPRVAQSHGCSASLLDVRENLKCGVRIMARNVVRDGTIGGTDADGASRGWRGVTRDWLSLRSAARRSDVASWTRRQSYCR